MTHQMDPFNKTSKMFEQIWSTAYKLIIFEEGRAIKEDLGDEGYHLVAFYLIKGFNNCICGTHVIHLLL